MKCCHCWLYLIFINEQKPGVRGKDNQFLPSKLNFDTQAVAAKICPQWHTAVAGLMGKQQLSWAGQRWGNMTLCMEGRSPTDPHRGTDPIEAASWLSQPSLGGQSGSKTGSDAMAVKEFLALTTEN